MAICPRTYLRLGCGNTPTLQLGASGVTIGIGSDGAASNASLDLWEQQRLAGQLQKFSHRDATLAPPAETLAWATTGGARALGWEGRLGRIAPGYQADLILIDAQAPHLTPAPDPVAVLAGAARPGDVRHVLVNGRLVMHEGQLLTLNRDQAMVEVEVRGERLRMAVQTPIMPE